MINKKICLLNESVFLRIVLTADVQKEILLLKE